MKPAHPKGFALLPLIIGILVLGILVGAGLTWMGPMVKKSKYDDTQDTLDAARQALIVWSITNGKLPDAASFAPAISSNRDAWGRQIIYIYDNNLTAVATGGICGRQSTTLSYGASANIAFLLVSGAEDLAINTTPGVTGAYIGNVASGTADLVRAVSLESLRNQAGCFSFLSGRLRILNNELPKACVGIAYAPSIQGEGGVSNYSWMVNVKPPWLTTNSNENVLNLSGTPSSGDVGDNVLDVAMTDADGNAIQRRYIIRVLSCGP